MLKQKYEVGLMTRTKILHAAKDVFLDKGYGAASMGMIAKQAGIPKSLLYHHFTNKEDLWHGVKHYIVFQSTLGDEAPIDYEGCKTLREYLSQVLELRLKIYMNNPDVAKLVSWQLLQGDEGRLGGSTQASPKTWLPALRNMQERGLMREDVNPETAMILINGAISVATTGLIELNFEDPKVYLEEVLETLDRGLKG